jgi:transposase, IS30 family
MGRGRPGPAPQATKREQFAALIARGVSNSQACRVVGVNRRTGKRWRHGRTITSSSGRRLRYAPVIDLHDREISPRFLSRTSVCLSGIGGGLASRCGPSPGTSVGIRPR